jgi:hypothetical protein
VAWAWHTGGGQVHQEHPHHPRPLMARLYAAAPLLASW